MTCISELRNDIDEFVMINFGFREFRGKAPFVGYFEVKSPSIMLIDPDVVKTVLVKNFKNFHDNAFSKMVKNTNKI